MLLLCHCSFDFSCWSISWWHCLIIDCISPAPDNMVHPPNHHLTHLTLVQSTPTTNRSQKYPQHGSPSQPPPTPLNPCAISPYNQNYPKSLTLTTYQSQKYYISPVVNMVHPPNSRITLLTLLQSTPTTNQSQNIHNFQHRLHIFATKCLFIHLAQVLDSLFIGLTFSFHLMINLCNHLMTFSRAV